MLMKWTEIKVLKQGKEVKKSEKLLSLLNKMIRVCYLIKR